MRARVENGRWVLLDPAGLPEGTEVEIVTRPVQSEPRSPMDVYLDDRLRQYIHALVVAASAPRYSAYPGAATGGYEEEVAARARSVAMHAGRRFTTPEDIKRAAPDVLGRLVATPQAIEQILRETPVP